GVVCRGVGTGCRRNELPADIQIALHRHLHAGFFLSFVHFPPAMRVTEKSVTAISPSAMGCRKTTLSGSPERMMAACRKDCSMPGERTKPRTSATIGKPSLFMT